MIGRHLRLRMLNDTRRHPVIVRETLLELVGDLGDLERLRLRWTRRRVQDLLGLL